jgi:spoIIIJ-associated protein
LGIGACNAVVKVSYEVPDPKPEKIEKAPAPKPEKKASEKKAEQKPAKPAAKQDNKPAQPKAEPVKAAAPVNPDEPAEYAAIRSFLSGLLEKMGVKADIEIGPRADADGIDVKLSGNSMGAIIGRRGETLDAIQHLTNYAVNRGSDKRLHINVDAEGYRSKREESLVKLAEKMAEKAIKYKRSMALEPMNSYERHVIHSALQKYEGVTTASTGVEPNRRVVVSYVKPETSNKPQSREWA